LGEFGQPLGFMDWIAC